VNPLRHLLLVVVLLFAQMAAGAHAVEHAANQEGTLTKHACELCLAGHDLGSALPSLASLPPVIAQRIAPDIREIQGRIALPPPLARQRDPPIA